jgi:beta-1,4-mannosyl-glycoprotein beta-1,4-N-acetylglucosaminyltransferase
MKTYKWVEIIQRLMQKKLPESASESMKIIDCFLFHNELDLLKARLSYLGETIDYFVISEANIDFSGQSKDFSLLNQLNHLPYSRKIIYNKVDINLQSIKWVYKKIRFIHRPHKFLWEIQNYQRNSILLPLNNLVLRKKDLIFLGDLDEIPNLELVCKIKSGGTKIDKPNVFLQSLFYYNLKNAINDNGWFGTICLPYQILLRHLPHKLRKNRENTSSIPNGGWHFSYFMKSEDIVKKVNAIADVEKLSNFKNLSLDEINLKIKNGLDLYGRDLKPNQMFIETPGALKREILKYLPYCI